MAHATLADIETYREECHRDDERVSKPSKSLGIGIKPGEYRPSMVRTSHAEIERRIEKYAHRAENKLDLWTGLPLEDNTTPEDEIEDLS